MPDAYCRGCGATFTRPLPAPYGPICPHCLARGDIVTLRDVPDRRGATHPRRFQARGDAQAPDAPQRLPR